MGSDFRHYEELLFPGLDTDHDNPLTQPHELMLSDAFDSGDTRRMELLDWQAQQQIKGWAIIDAAQNPVTLNTSENPLQQ